MEHAKHKGMTEKEHKAMKKAMPYTGATQPPKGMPAKKKGNKK